MRIDARWFQKAALAQACLLLPDIFAAKIQKAGCRWDRRCMMKLMKANVGYGVRFSSFFINNTSHTKSHSVLTA